MLSSRDREIKDLLVKFKPLFKKKIRKLINYGFDGDELMSVCSLALVDAYNRYDESKGHFANYLVFYVNMHLNRFTSMNKNLITPPVNLMSRINLKRSELKIKENYNLISYTDINEFENDIYEDVNQNTENTALKEELKKKALIILGKRNYKILYNFMAGRTLAEIGIMFNLSKERIRQICDGSIDKLKKELKI